MGELTLLPEYIHTFVKTKAYKSPWLAELATAHDSVPEASVSLFKN